MTGLILFIAGVFTIIATQSDWEWYWNDRRARMWISLFGEEGAKTVLTILGGIIMIGGAILMCSGYSK